MSELKEPFEKEEFFYVIGNRVVVTYPSEHTQMVFSRSLYDGYYVQMNLYNSQDLVYLGEDKKYQSLDEVYELYLTTWNMQENL